MLIGAAVLVVAAAAAGYYFMTQSGGSTVLSTMGNTSLRTLLAGVNPQKCTFDNGQSTGTIYVAGGKMRGDFESKTEMMTAKSHMVISNSISYVWLDGMKQGYRMAFDDMAKNNGSQGEGIDADAKVATKCESWQANETMFTLPTDVTFNEVGMPPAQTKTTPAQGASAGAGASVGASASGKAPSAQDYTAQQCAACAAVTDPSAKAQCMAVFDCPAQ